MAQAQAGWYPDPSGDVTRLRYWDGSRWTDDYAQQPDCQQPGYQQPGWQQPGTVGGQTCAQSVAAAGADRTLFLVAFVFCIITTVASCWLIIPLAWMIPMSVHCWGIYKGRSRNTVAFGVCTLLFVSLVAGILLLVGEKD